MEAIESVDWGAYAHFRLQADQYPEIVPFMRFGYYLSDYLAVGALFSLAAALFTVQGKYRSAQIVALSLVASLGLIFGTRFLIPRIRPPDALNWLGPSEMAGSYPSANVFLFMLAMILLGVALWGMVHSWLPWTIYAVVAAALTGWVCMSQFYLALHFMTDIVGGMAGATLVGWLAWLVMKPPAGEQRSSGPIAHANLEAIQDRSRGSGIEQG